MTTPLDGFPPRQLDVSVYDMDGCRVLSLTGECDIATREMLESGLTDALTDKGRVLIVDLSDLEFCDGGAAALVLVAAQDNPLVLVGLNGSASYVFDLLDPADQVPRYPTVSAAVNDLSEHA